jgi:hypothetical protein
MLAKARTIFPNQFIYSFFQQFLGLLRIWDLPEIVSLDRSILAQEFLCLQVPKGEEELAFCNLAIKGELIHGAALGTASNLELVLTTSSLLNLSRLFIKARSV